MVKRLMVAVMILTASILLSAVAQAGAEEDMALKAEQALQAVLPDVKVLSVERAALKDLWEVGFKSRNDKGVVYLDEKMEFILVGSLIKLSSGTNFTKLKYDTLTKVDFSSIPLDDSLVMGDPKAKYKVVVFDDPD